MRPVFIFSLPRSGSTLLQRILATHPTVDTSSEPWILLPAGSALRNGGFADYGCIPAKKAISDFLDQTDGGRDAYSAALRSFGSTLYKSAAVKEATHFVDKTPRYHLIVEQILEAFPSAKFVFLWRNPLSVATSISNTWSEGKWEFGHYRIDLYEGVKKLTSNSLRIPKSRAFRIKYEEIVKSKHSKMEKVFDYLNLKYYPEKVEKFLDVGIVGRFGDPKGIDKYDKISEEPIVKWKKSVKNKIRKVWCKKYINWIGKERLEHMGYNMEKLTKEIESTSVGKEMLISDLLSILKDSVRPWIHPTIQKKYFDKYKKGRLLYDVH